MSAFTDDQRAELADLIAEAVAEAVQPIARQTTAWIQQERRRLEQPRRTWTGAAPGGPAERSNQ